MRSRRVLLVVENVSLARDHRLRKQVGALHRAGYRVSVICRHDPSNRVPAGVRLLEYPAPADGRSAAGFLWEYGYSLIMAARLTARAFLRGGFDAVQISGTPDIYFVIGVPFRLLGKRVLLDLRDLSPELYEVRYGRRGAVYRMLRVLEWLTFRSVDHVITVNGSLDQIVRGRGHVPADNVTVVGNGPALSRVHPRSPDAALRNGRRHLCCWLGLMGPQDNLGLALEAVAYFVHTMRRTDCQFAFVGDGESLTDARRQAQELGVSPWVSFPGWLGEESAFTYLCTADLGLEPNLEAIVSPVKVMEYMAFELPFVAFDLAETRLLGGDAGAYARPADLTDFARLTAELLDDPERRRRMGIAGKDRVRTDVAWEHQERAYLQAYHAVFGDPPRVARPAGVQ